ncbi:MAG: caspase family protein, partial [Archangium sp.]|nr:caspase family protein [Archangium sp.]
MISLVAVLTVLHATPPAPPRRAVLVGTNAAVEGRAPLRFAHGDAQSLAEVLRSSGGFSAADVVVLLDPTPEAVLSALESARTALASSEGLLVFYYSGHADEARLYPGGRALTLEALRERLADATPGVRIGIIDACRGGGWTHAKGLEPTAPFEVGLPALSSEGTALIAASSGLEEAHEAEALHGSFFTHHLVAGLRGAADHSGDGQVTLSEAFGYANRLTIRDTATRAREAQHPSFDFRLRGRQDVVLTSVQSAGAQLVLAQDRGPLEVVQLSTGLTVVEALPGERVVRLTLPPGAYLVRRVL